MDVLNTYRAFLIASGRWHALRIAYAHGTVVCRQVRKAMADAGLLDRYEHIGDYWLGAVFHSPLFEWTGEWFKYTDAARNIHERTVKIWRLSPLFGRLPDDEPPTVPYICLPPEQIESEEVMVLVKRPRKRRSDAHE